MEADGLGPVLEGNPTDASLVDRARSGDQAAFCELARRHASAGWRYAVVCGATRASATRIAGRALTLALATVGFGSWEIDDPFRPWVLRRVRDLTIKARWTNADDPEAVTIERAWRGSLPPASAAFARMPEPQRSALWLTQVEGFEPSAVAVVLHLTTGAGTAAVSEARTALEKAVGAGDESVLPQRAVAPFAIPVPSSVAAAVATSWRTWSANRAPAESVVRRRFGQLTGTVSGHIRPRLLAGAGGVAVTVGLVATALTGGGSIGPVAPHASYAGGVAATPSGGDAQTSGRSDGGGKSVPRVKGSSITRKQSAQGVPASIAAPGLRGQRPSTPRTTPEAGPSTAPWWTIAFGGLTFATPAVRPGTPGLTSVDIGGISVSGPVQPRPAGPGPPPASGVESPPSSTSPPAAGPLPTPPTGPGATPPSPTPPPPPPSTTPDPLSTDPPTTIPPTTIPQTTIPPIAPCGILTPCP